jgi:hypothetical protein
MTVHTYALIDDLSLWFYAETSVRRGAVVVEFRRGLDDKKYEKVWQKLWHFNERCERYPTRNFIARAERPPDDELCARCNGA